MMRSGFGRSLAAGLAGGAAGATALNAVTYLDMAWRGRPASTSPEQLVEKLSDATGMKVPGEGKTRGNRVSGLGALMGIATGVGVGVALVSLRAVGIRPGVVLSSVLAGAGAMAASDLPLAALKISDPRTWTRAQWLSDIIPHAVFGVVTALVVNGVARR
jgi:hypothetical protein